jgi:DNA-directed RNA polymerase specialized sigma24 family protein
VRTELDLTGEIERVYRARYGTFLRVAMAILRDERLAEEAVHDGFVRALRHRKGFGARGSVEGWIWRIVVNEAHRRGAAERKHRVEPAAADPPVTPPGEVGPVEALVAALPARQRLALFLRYYADLDYETIAEVLGVKSGTVAATLHAAHAALRRELLEVNR